MEWRIDTSREGEVEGKSLREVLEKARDHWRDTQAKQAGDAANAQHGSPKSGSASDVTEHALKVARDSNALGEAHTERSEELLDTMNLAIETACSLAEHLEGTVAVTISGHDDRRHQSGCGKRISVQVDQTLPPE